MRGRYGEKVYDYTVTLRIDRYRYIFLKTVAKEMGKSMSDVIRLMIDYAMSIDPEDVKRFSSPSPS